MERVIAMYYGLLRTAECDECRRGRRGGGARPRPPSAKLAFEKAADK